MAYQISAMVRSPLETRWMGICPKKAVTALNASRPDRILTIHKDTAATEAMAQLMPEAERQTG